MLREQEFGSLTYKLKLMCFNTIYQIEYQNISWPPAPTSGMWIIF